jgi:hypothetical protein
MAEHGQDSHGNTVAAWTCVGLLMLASFTMALAVVLTSWTVFAVGAAIAVIGLVAGKLLSLAGYGSRPAAEHGVDAR